MRTTITHVKHPTKIGFKCGTRNRWGYTAPEGKEPTCKLCSGTRRASRNPAISPEGHIKPGDIFYDSWGYNMTIVDFYKVTRLTPKGAEFVGIGQEETADGYLSGTTLPKPEINLQRRGVLKAKQYGNEDVYFTGTMKNIYGEGDHQRREVHLTRWHGRPVHFNHCD